MALMKVYFATPGMDEEYDIVSQQVRQDTTVGSFMHTVRAEWEESDDEEEWVPVIKHKVISLTSTVGEHKVPGKKLKIFFVQRSDADAAIQRGELSDLGKGAGGKGVSTSSGSKGIGKGDNASGGNADVRVLSSGNRGTSPGNSEINVVVNQVIRSLSRDRTRVRANIVGDDCMHVVP